MEIEILHWKPLFALGLCRLVGKAVGTGAAPGPADALGLRCSSSEVPKVDALVGRTTVKTQVQVLVVAAYLPDYDGCSDVSRLNLHMLPGNLLHHTQGVRSVAVASVLRAVCKRSRQLVCLCVVHLLVHTFLEVLKDDCQLQNGERNRINIQHSLYGQLLRFSGSYQ
uniref:Secreted protein n=1 Tax=Neolamprologus brichardi TaxID=32507 RepID=A0A3Q4I9B7_NEOBR